MMEFESINSAAYARHDEHSLRQRQQIVHMAIQNIVL
jgi:hypothetical protein